MWLFELFIEGGFIMWPLLLCSLLVWAVAIERWFYMNKFKTQSSMVYSNALELLKKNKWDEFKGVSRSANPLIQRLYFNLLDKGRGSALWQNNIERRFQETQADLKRYLWILGTIGNLAPFIGLFGTVVGIIKSFESISKTGKSGFAVVSGGLAEALIATAAGIIVAVISVMFFNYFQTRIRNLSLTFKNEVEEVRDLLMEEN
ncbi:MAG: MotA/TolQ/ExbB proton channel family protein [Bacteriovoracaceae bacterium]